MKKLTVIVLLLPLLCRAQPAAIVQLAKEVSVQDLQKNLYYLASPQLEGRLTGSHGDTLAVEYVAGWFKKYHVLAPYNAGKSYLQSVTLHKAVPGNCSISVKGKNYRQFIDWYVFFNNTYTTHLPEALPVVFAGYGITSDRYNDLAGIEVKGKAVMVIQAQPGDNIPALVASSARNSISADYLKNLSDRGAAAALVVTADFEQTARALRAAGASRNFRNLSATGNAMPRIYISEAMAGELLRQQDVTLALLKKNIRDKHHPLSFDTKDSIRIQLQVKEVEVPAPNVIGIIRGKDTAAAAVVMSAHHDHLGMREQAVYAGAADNASGTAALMELAKLVQLAAQKGIRPRRTIVFASFTGEEQGLLGAYYFTEHPVIPTEKIWADYNLDMLGRVDSFYSGKIADSNYVYFLYRDSLDHGLHQALLKANETAGLTLDDRYQQSASSVRRLTGSDQYAFYRKGIPVLRTDCGFTKDYHQLTDTPDKINFPLLARQTQLAFLTLWNIANE